MTDALRAELTEMMTAAKWEWLEPHVYRDAVIIVDPQLDLVEVGVAIATDQSTQVQRWIAEAQLTKPSITQQIRWSKLGNVEFMTIIVQPFVLVRLADQANQADEG